MNSSPEEPVAEDAGDADPSFPRRRESSPATDDDTATPEPSSGAKRYKLTIAYDGAKFHGWQKQLPPTGERIRTVAGVIEEQLQRLFGHPIDLVGASRTDAGVHARGQVAHFDGTTRIPDERLVLAINSRMPDDIDILAAEPIDPSFDAIRGAVNKQYRYRILTGRQKPLDRRHVVYHCFYPIDVDRMNDAARRLVGTHDFNGFAAANHGRTTTVRTIFDCHVEEAANNEVHVVVSGSGFLYNMVRIISGTLLEVGRGIYEPDVIDKALASTDRRDAGSTLPPQGLVLEWIRYAEDVEASASVSDSDEPLA